MAASFKRPYLHTHWDITFHQPGCLCIRGVKDVIIKELFTPSEYTQVVMRVIPVFVVTKASDCSTALTYIAGCPYCWFVPFDAGAQASEVRCIDGGIPRIPVRLPRLSHQRIRREEL